jgi:hypothetical protein
MTVTWPALSNASGTSTTCARALVAIAPRATART